MCEDMSTQDMVPKMGNPRGWAPPTEVQHPLGGREALGDNEIPQPGSSWEADLQGDAAHEDMWGRFPLLCQCTEVGTSFVLLVITQIIKYSCPGTHAYVTCGHKLPYTTTAPHEHPATGSQTLCNSSIHRDKRLWG